MSVANVSQEEKYHLNKIERLPNLVCPEVFIQKCSQRRTLRAALNSFVIAAFKFSTICMQACLNFWVSPRQKMVIPLQRLILLGQWEPAPVPVLKGAGQEQVNQQVRQSY
jgi:hypothetical protein